MIYDTPEQKQFIIEAVKKFPCNYEQALQLANHFGQSIQDGTIIPLKDQPKGIPSDQVEPKAPSPAEEKTKANRKVRRALKSVKKK